jgi:competence protein CoiA
MVPIEEFLNAAFSKRLRFGKPQPDVDTNSVNVMVTVHTGVLDCWHSSCGAETRIITFINFMPDDLQFRVSNLDPEILQFVLDQLPPDLEIGRIKPRYSKTVEQTYMSNGCVRCDRLIGEHYEHDAWGIDETLHTFPMWITRKRLKALRKSRGYDDKEESYVFQGPDPEMWHVDPEDADPA